VSWDVHWETFFQPSSLFELDLHVVCLSFKDNSGELIVVEANVVAGADSFG
jgi:hypothetical protein